MVTRFIADYDLHELKEKLNSIIEVKNEDNVKTHLRQTLLFKNEGLISGTMDKETFKIWTHEQGRAGLTGFFIQLLKADRDN